MPGLLGCIPTPTMYSYANNAFLRQQCIPNPPVWSIPTPALLDFKVCFLGCFMILSFEASFMFLWFLGSWSQNLFVTRDVTSYFVIFGWKQTVEASISVQFQFSHKFTGICKVVSHKFTGTWKLLQNHISVESQRESIDSPSNCAWASEGEVPPVDVLMCRCADVSMCWCVDVLMCFYRMSKNLIRTWSWLMTSEELMRRDTSYLFRVIGF